MRHHIVRNVEQPGHDLYEAGVSLDPDDAIRFLESQVIGDKQLRGKIVGFEFTGIPEEVMCIGGLVELPESFLRLTP